MAEYSFPFDSRVVNGVPDRPFNSEDDRLRYGSLISNGIYPNPSNNLQVMANGGMNIAIKQGLAWNNGGFYYANADILKALQPPDSVYARTDIVVLRFDSVSERKIYIDVKTGVPSLSAVTPVLTRNKEVYELQLAKITIPSNIAEITQSNIQDNRLDKNLCGVVTGLIEQVDTTTLFNQYTTSFEELRQQYNDEFFAWFNELETNLTGDVATNLQLQINQIKTDLENTLNTVNSELSDMENNLKHLRSDSIGYIYVSENGDNNNDGLTRETPVLTLQKAFDLLPRYFDIEKNISKGVNIVLLTDIEMIDYTYFSNNENYIVRIKSDSTLKRNVYVNDLKRTISFLNCRHLEFQDVTFTNITLSFTACNYVFINSVDFDANVTMNSAILAQNGSNVNINLCQAITTYPGSFIYATSMAKVNFSNCIGKVGNYNFEVQDGAIIIKGKNNTITATAANELSSGGVILIAT